MTRALSPRQALARIPGWGQQELAITRLAGGLMNSSFLVTTPAASFVLRLNAWASADTGIDRDIELLVQRHAAAAGIAPDIVYADPVAGFLLCRYLNGQAWSVEQLADDRALSSIAELLQQVHALPRSGVSFDAVAIAADYAGALDACPELIPFAARCQALVASIEPSDTLRCCHNDVVLGNIIASPELQLIDWEYARDNDPLFDLASLIGFHDLSDEQARILLRCYDGDLSHWDRLLEQRCLFDAIQWLWLAARLSQTSDARAQERLEDLERRILRHCSAA